MTPKVASKKPEESKEPEVQHILPITASHEDGDGSGGGSPRSAGSGSSIPLSDGFDLTSQISKNTSFHGSDVGSGNPDQDTLRNLLSHTLTFPKMLDYYK